ncbi:MAG: AAA family ATPase, partial [Moorellales bacterium]
MHIRELEVSGFKSFPHRIRLEFTPGLTAIIGPNGCGKSNLVDAMRWVLGEQNPRVLRADRMEELIFGGNHRLKPLGRAEVSLTLDNTDGRLGLDYGEIRITRRLFRSGEGEYLLNQVPCRLRDIQQLLWDTGVSRQGFAVIGQGQVEEFLAATPEERRVFLEEAAGVVRYHHRRREAEL